MKCPQNRVKSTLRFPETTLTAWKTAHEDRVTTLLAAGLGAKPTVAIHVKARFGAGEGRILSATVQQMMDATLQAGHYFDDRTGLKIVDADDARRDTDEGYWDNVENTLQTRLQAQLRRTGNWRTSLTFLSSPVAPFHSWWRSAG